MRHHARQVPVYFLLLLRSVSFGTGAETSQELEEDPEWKRAEGEGPTVSLGPWLWMQLCWRQGGVEKEGREDARCNTQICIRNQDRVPWLLGAPSAFSPLGVASAGESCLTQDSLM